MNRSVSVLSLISEGALRKEPCKSCRPKEPDTKCSFNADFTHCPWTGNMLPWARRLVGSWMTIEGEPDGHPAWVGDGDA